MSYNDNIDAAMFQYAKIIKEKDKEIEKLKKIIEKLKKKQDKIG